MNNHTNPVDIKELRELLCDVGQDALARWGDFDSTPFQKAVADAEIALTGRLADLVVTDDDARSFVRRWRSLVEATESGEYPQRRGALFASSAEATWVIGRPRLWAAVTVFDAFVQGVNSAHQTFLRLLLPFLQFLRHGM